jgi:murein DD-endopeptidase MepM/ murein hydrolase activator NlpD
MIQLRKKRNVLMLATLLLSACTAIHTPSVRLPERSSVMPGETVTVTGRENVYGLARAHNVSMRDVIVLNNLQAPYILKPGQQITLPAGGSVGSYTSYPQGISSGPGVSAAPNGQAPLPTAAPSGAIESVPLEPVKGGTANPTEISPFAPGVGEQKQGILTPSSRATNQTAVDVLNAPRASRPIPTTITPQTTEQMVPTTRPSTPPLQPALLPLTATSPTSIAMVWPVKGPILSGFGPKGQGLNNDGVNIGAPKGAPVVAAAAGTVVYAGSEMKGFGNLVLVRHERGWVTAYAHLERMLVSKDAIVGQGDMIGTVGKTGNVPSPQLHFETRYEGKSVDPGSIIKSD